MIPIDQFSPLRQYSDLDDAFAYHLRLVPGFFHPVGSLALEPGKFDVYYLPEKAEPPDGDWMCSRLPSDTNIFASLLTQGFSQYCSAPWCGADARADVLAAISRSEFYPSGAIQRFEEEGYTPFFEIQQIMFFRRADAVLVSGRVEVDLNLVEHGIEIKLSAQGVEFGYMCDFYGDLLPDES